MGSGREQTGAIDIGAEVQLLDFQSSYLPDPMELSVAVLAPRGASPAPTTLYVLDANFFYASVVQLVGMLQLTDELPPMCVVGVGYPLRSIYSNHAAFTQLLNRRSRDNLAVTVDLGRMPRKMTSPTGGGAPRLLDSLIEEIIPLVEQSLDVDPARHAIVGHSGGGHFALYAGLARPDVFSRVVAGTPVLFSYELFDVLATKWTTSVTASDTRLFVGTGELETPEQVDDIHRFVERLAASAPPGAQIASHTFESETHQSVWPAIFSRGLRVVLGPLRDGDSPLAIVTRGT